MYVELEGRGAHQGESCSITSSECKAKNRIMQERKPLGRYGDGVFRMEMVFVNTVLRSMVAFFRVKRIRNLCLMVSS